MRGKKFKVEGRLTLNKDDLTNASANIATTVVDCLIELPASTTMKGLGDIALSIRDRNFLRKVDTVRETFQGADEVLLWQTVTNLRDSFDDSHFDEVWFSSIEKADSSRSAKISGQALLAYSKGLICIEHFWGIQSCVAHLSYRDILKALNVEVQHIELLPIDIKLRLVATGLGKTLAVYGGTGYDWNNEFVKSLIISVENVDRSIELTKRVVPKTN